MLCCQSEGELISNKLSKVDAVSRDNRMMEEVDEEDEEEEVKVEGEEEHRPTSPMSDMELEKVQSH